MVLLRCCRKSDGDSGAEANKVVVGWICEKTSRKCVRTLAAKVSNDQCLYSLNVCKLICDRFGSLWPLPTKNLTIESYLIPIECGKISFKLDIPSK